MPTTPYHERLGVPRPDMKRAAERYRHRELRLIDLLVAVLLERGGPVAPDEAGARLAEGSVAFAANHADDEDLQHRLDLVHDRMATVERWAVN